MLSPSYGVVKYVFRIGRVILLVMPIVFVVNTGTFAAESREYDTDLLRLVTTYDALGGDVCAVAEEFCMLYMGSCELDLELCAFVEHLCKIVMRFCS